MNDPKRIMLPCGLLSALFLLMLTATPLSAANDRGELLPDDAVNIAGNVMSENGAIGPVRLNYDPNRNALPHRDEGPHDIAYDDGRISVYFPAEDLWGRVSFTAPQDFQLQAVRIMLYNFNNVDEACNIHVYEEADNRNLGDLLVSLEVDDPNDRGWITLDLDEDDFVDFDAGESFSIVYGPAPGGDPERGGRGWWLLGDEDTEGDHSYVVQEDDPPERHADWLEVESDLMCRANGEFQGDGIDLAVSGAIGETETWSVREGEDFVYTAFITNESQNASEGFVVTFWAENIDGDRVWESEVVFEDEFEEGDEAEIESEPWDVEDAGYHVIHILVEPFEEDVFEDNNELVFEQIAMGDDGDVWLGYNDVEIAGRNWVLEDEGDPIGVAFYHPGVGAPLAVSALRANLIPGEGIRRGTEIDFEIFRWNPDDEEFESVWDGTGETVSEEEAQWIEVELDEDEIVEFNEDTPILVTYLYMEDVSIRSDEEEPLSAGQGGMPAVSVFWFEGEWQVFQLADLEMQIQTVDAEGGGGGGPLLAVDPEDLDFGEDLEQRREYVIEATFSGIGDEDVEVEEIVIPQNLDDYITVSDDNFVVPAGEDVVIEVTFRADEHVELEGRILVQNDSENMERFFWDVTASTEEGGGLQHFVDFENTDTNHSLLVTDLQFNGEQVPAGWEVGVFTADNILAGASVWEEERMGISAFGDDAQTEDVVEGFVADERIRFKAWDNDADIEYASGAGEILEGNLNWTSNGLTVLSLIISDELELELIEGWNLISINIDPVGMYAEGEDRGPDVVIMMEELRIDEDEHRLVIIKDEAGRFHLPSFDFNNIPYWNLTEGYWAKMAENFDVTYNGVPIPFDEDVPIEEGWNIIAYFPGYALDASAPDFDVIAPIVDNVVIAKDVVGRFLLPEFEFSNMQPWRKTQGYQIKVDDDVVLNYPAENRAAGFSAEPSVDPRDTFAPTSENMSVLLNDIDGSIRGNTRAVAVNAAGTIVGWGEVNRSRSGIAIWGDDPTSETVEGLRPGEAFDLHLQNTETGEQTPLAVTLVRQGNGLVYGKDEIVVLDAAVGTAVPEQFYVSGSYPNPFNAVTKFSYGIPEAAEVTIGVFDLAGRRIAMLAQGMQSAGHHSVAWDAASAVSGVYLLKLESAAYSASRKVVLVK